MESEVPNYRVTRLLYRFVTDESLDRFERPAPRRGTMGEWEYLLDGGVLHLTPAKEFRDRQAARDDVEPLLRAYEESAELMTPPHQIHFEYDHSDIEEIDPQPGFVNLFPETLTVRVEAFAPTVSVTSNNTEYPPPDPDFIRTELGDRLLARYRRVRAGTAELPAEGYYVLTSIEDAYGRTKPRRRAAARELNIDPAVLDKLGELTSKADPDIGRKAGTPKPLTADERGWIDAAIALLIRRIGHHASRAVLPPLTMSDLPALA
jgi:hypothetical protein